jgi:hypothetical protein
MLKKNEILDEVEKTFQAFDNDIILEENPFLFTRLKTEIEYRLQKQKKSFATGWKQAIILIVLLINIVTLVYYYEWNIKQNSQEKLVLELRADFRIEKSQNNF